MVLGVIRMKRYSKYWAELFLEQDWTNDFIAVSDDGFSKQEIESLFRQAKNGELLKKNSGNIESPIVLPETAYRRLEEAERNMKSEYEILVRENYQIDYTGYPIIIGELFNGYYLHDSWVISLNKAGRDVELLTLVEFDSNRKRYRNIVFKNARIVKPFWPKDKQIEKYDVWKNEEYNYRWLYDEVVHEANGKYEVHVLMQHWGRLSEIAIQFQDVSEEWV